MSKVFKSIGKAVSKVGKFVKKHWKTILLVAAVVFTAGAALGAWGPLAGTVQAGTFSWQAAGAAWKGFAVGVKNAVTGLWSGGAKGAAAAAPNTAPAAIGNTAASVSYSVGGVAQAPVVSNLASVGSGAAQTAAAGGVKGFLMSPGGGILGATGLNMAGGYYQAEAAQEQADKDRDRSMRESVAYGFDRYGNKSNTYQPINWDSMMGAPAVTGAGLMAPQSPVAGAPGPSQPGMTRPQTAPQTIDELIASRNAANNFSGA